MILDNIHNHYETLVYEEMLRYQRDKAEQFEEHTLEDVACLALNRLPSRYVRHSVDTVFYLTIAEREKMDQDVRDAVATAFEMVSKHPRED